MINLKYGLKKAHKTFYTTKVGQKQKKKMVKYNKNSNDIDIDNCVRNEDGS